jgi:phosphate:Na+ symporter
VLMTLATVVGGIGLFLLGMILMTDGLKSVAGNSLREWLQRFTGRRRSAVLAGAGITALVQSSSATTLATIGFVSAGLLSFQNSIGVIIGANIGTTSTGWIVALLGLKLSMGKIALPLIGVGALMRLLGKDRIAHGGMALAGFGLIFVGIDTLQTGMAGLAGRIDLTQFTATGLRAIFALVLIGMAMTVVMQSSSAAVAMTLTALAGDTITIEQAATLVIGQNVGTTVKAGIAAIGASVAARRTALVHVIFNFGTGAVALLLLPLFVKAVNLFQAQLAGEDYALTLAAFHTAFNLLGAAIFLPLTGQMSKLAHRLIRERGTSLTRNIDASQRDVPGLAIGSAHQALQECAARLFDTACVRLRGFGEEPAVYEVGEALRELRRFLDGVTPPTRSAEFHQMLELLHVLDHLQQINASVLPAMPSLTIRETPELQQAAEALAEALQNVLSHLDAQDLQAEVAQLAEQSAQLADRSRSARPAVLRATAERHIGIETALARLAAQRWLEKLAYQAWRVALHLQAVRKPQEEPAHTAQDAPAEPPPEH